jgi:hypothetical protein
MAYINVMNSPRPRPSGPKMTVEELREQLALGRRITAESDEDTLRRLCRVERVRAPWEPLPTTTKEDVERHRRLARESIGF